jgi:hypothetical protein
MRGVSGTHPGRTGPQTRLALPESQDGLNRLKKPGQSNITTRSGVNKEIRTRGKLELRIPPALHLRGIVGVDKCVQFLLDLAER